MKEHDDEQQPPEGVPPPQEAKDPHCPPAYPRHDAAPAPQYVQNPLRPTEEMGCFEKCYQIDSINMSYYNQQQPPIGVPPPQGYPVKDPYPPPGYPGQSYPPPGYPPQCYAPQYVQQPPPRQETVWLHSVAVAYLRLAFKFGREEVVGDRIVPFWEAESVLSSICSPLSLPNDSLLLCPSLDQRNSRSLQSSGREGRRREGKMGACGYWKPPLSLKSHGEKWVFTWLHNYGQSVRLGSPSGWRLLEMRKKRESRFERRCRECEQSSVVAGESDEEFVKVLRQVQPYMSAHIKTVFVLVLSAEIVDSPCLDATLKEKY
ncbi:unnamed protein product [Sphenostylis stenocarpa]|uniref:Uncharacterized protein n=1 Tax=Sphenostylis stenocarpa TaxID=92480 RepID=A0AA86S6C1_9FABA|nr:unnamed protein product [Sphenostylis stenocarpa]